MDFVTEAASDDPISIATLIGEVAHYAAETLAVILAIGLVVGIAHWVRRRRGSAQQARG